MIMMILMTKASIIRARHQLIRVVSLVHIQGLQSDLSQPTISTVQQQVVELQLILHHI